MGNAVIYFGQEAIKNARAGKGPTFIEALTYRWHEHVGEKLDDYSGLRSPNELKNWIKKDPIKKLEQYLLNKKIINHEKIKDTKSQIDKLVKNAFEYAINSPLPAKEDLLLNVYA